MKIILTKLYPDRGQRAVGLSFARNLLNSVGLVSAAPPEFPGAAAEMAGPAPAFHGRAAGGCAYYCLADANVPEADSRSR